MVGINESVINPLRRLRGVDLTTGFFMNPTQGVAFAVDHRRNCFVRLDLHSGEQTDIDTEGPRTFVLKKRHSRNIFVTVNQNRFIYSLFVDERTNMIFIVTFCFTTDNAVRIIKEHNTEIKMEKNSLFDFQLDQQGLICVYSSHRIPYNRTNIQWAKIRVNDDGQIILPISKWQKILIDNWHRAFFYTDHYYVIPVHGFSFMFKLNRIHISGSQSSLVDIPNAAKLPELKDMHYCSPAEVINSKVVFYTYNKRNSLGYFLILDLDTIKLEVFEIGINDHLIANNARVRYSPNDLLYLHGCCMENCDDKAHIYVFDVSEIIMR